MNPAALITGASRGIGRGIALELARLGYDLVVNYARNGSAAGETALECVASARSCGQSIRAEICQADIAESGQRERLIEFAKTNFGRLDLLVNNAGVAPELRADLLETTEQSLDRLLRINLKAPFLLTQLVSRYMIEQVRSGALSPAGKPKIIFVSSISAYAASVNRGDYCIAKAALSMLTPLFAARLAEHGINVYEIRPGIISTEMTLPAKDKYDRLIEQGLTPIKRWGTPQDVGKAVGAIAQDLLPFSTGEVLNVDGGFHVRTL